MEPIMEEIEVSSWLMLDAIKKAAEVVETVGNLQTGHFMYVFCVLEEDYLELCYSDTASNFLRRYEDKDEFQMALEKRKEEEGESPYEDDRAYEEDYEGEERKDEDEFEDDTEKY
jgi:hypothetical protein